MFNAITIHYGSKCTRDPRCKWCYGKSHKERNKSIKFFCDLIPYLKKITSQVALGSYGELLLYPQFASRFSQVARKHKLVVNLTSNGDLVRHTDVSILKGFKLVSLSFNSELIKNKKELDSYFENIKYLKKLGIKTGCNLLIDEGMFVKDRRKVPYFVSLVKFLFDNGVDRVFSLYPKNTKAPDITKFKLWFYALGSLYKHFYVDDSTRSILVNRSYTKWKEPCHFGQNAVNINSDGSVTGCSFDNKVYMTIQKPKDIIKIKKLEFEKRYNCPYIHKIHHSK